MSNTTNDGVDPNKVISPTDKVADLVVIYDGKRGVEGDPWSGWSVAKMTYDGEPDCLGIRWNGVAGEHIGTPSARGYPIWFILPWPIAQIAMPLVKAYLAGKEIGQRWAHAKEIRRRNEEAMAARASAAGEPPAPSLREPPVAGPELRT